MLFAHKRKLSEEGGSAKRGPTNASPRASAGARWGNPSVILRKNEASQRWIVCVADRPLSEIKQGQTLRIVALDGARSGFEKQSDARNWWGKRALDIDFVKQRVAARRWVTYRLNERLHLEPMSRKEKA